MKSQNIIVVLGGGIDEDGNLPSWAKDRVEKGVGLLNQGSGDKIIMSGKGIDEYPVAEALAMKEYGVELGSDMNSILEEPLSKNTIENAYFTRALHLDHFPVKRIVLITNEFHNERSKRIFEWMFPNAEIQCEPVSDDELDEKLLEQRKYTEQKQMEFCDGLFGQSEPGNMNVIHSFIYDENDKYNILYKELGVELKKHMVLY